MNKKGFTLTEILVVIIIIGLLTAIAVPGYRKAVEKAKAVQAVSILNDAAKAEQVFALATSRYTKYWDDLVINHPNMVAGAVYCLEGTNTPNQEDCDNDSTYKVKLTVGNPDTNSVVMATRMLNNPYSDYKLFKFMDGDPNIYCKSAATSPTDICQILGFPTKNLPETRNIDRTENFKCADEIPDCSVQNYACISGVSNYNNCEKTIYDDGSFERIVYDDNGNLYDMFTYNSEGNITGDIWYNNNNSLSAVFYENGIRKNMITVYPFSVHPTAGDHFAVATYDENGIFQQQTAYYPSGIVANYHEYDKDRNRWGYFANYNNDGSLKNFQCFTDMCGGSGTCTGEACYTSKYKDYLPDTNSFKTYDAYLTPDDIARICNIPSNGAQFCN